jgi:hypothetical protein
MDEINESNMNDFLEKKLKILFHLQNIPTPYDSDSSSPILGKSLIRLMHLPIEKRYSTGIDWIEKKKCFSCLRFDPCLSQAI